MILLEDMSDEIIVNIKNPVKNLNKKSLKWQQNTAKKRWYSKINPVFWSSLLWALRIGIAAMISGFPCLFPKINTLTSGICFVAPAMSVLSIGGSFGQTLLLFNNVFNGAILGFTIGIPEGLLCITALHYFPYPITATIISSCLFVTSLILWLYSTMHIVKRKICLLIFIFSILGPTIIDGDHIYLQYILLIVTALCCVIIGTSVSLGVYIIFPRVNSKQQLNLIIIQCLRYCSQIFTYTMSNQDNHLHVNNLYVKLTQALNEATALANDIAADSFPYIISSYDITTIIGYIFQLNIIKESLCVIPPSSQSMDTLTEGVRNYCYALSRVIKGKNIDLTYHSNELLASINMLHISNDESHFQIVSCIRKLLSPSLQHHFRLSHKRWEIINICKNFFTMMPLPSPTFFVRCAIYSMFFVIAALFPIIPYLREQYYYNIIPIWVPVSMAFVSDPQNLSSTFRIVILRNVGTVIAAMLAWGIIYISFGHISIYLILYFIGTCFLGYISTSKDYDHAGVLGGATIQLIIFNGIVLLGTSWSGVDATLLVFNRIQMVLIGTALAAIAALLYPLSSRALLMTTVNQSLCTIHSCLATIHHDFKLYRDHMSNPLYDGTQCYKFITLQSELDAISHYITKQNTLIVDVEYKPNLWRFPFPNEIWRKIVKYQNKCITELHVLNTIMSDNHNHDMYHATHFMIDSIIQWYDNLMTYFRAHHAPQKNVKPILSLQSNEIPIIVSEICTPEMISRIHAFIASNQRLRKFLMIIWTELSIIDQN